MELKEPGNELPNQTRKFVLYFSEKVTYHIDHGSKTIIFSPEAGGNYNGIMQLGYLGAGPRGDTSNINFLDNHFGIYSYKPSTSYCVSESRNKAYANFDWNPVNGGAFMSEANLLMVALPHHVRTYFLLLNIY